LPDSSADGDELPPSSTPAPEPAEAPAQKAAVDAIALWRRVRERADRAHGDNSLTPSHRKVARAAVPLDFREGTLRIGFHSNDSGVVSWADSAFRDKVSHWLSQEVGATARLAVMTRPIDGGDAAPPRLEVPRGPVPVERPAGLAPPAPRPKDKAASFPKPEPVQPVPVREAEPSPPPCYPEAEDSPADAVAETPMADSFGAVDPMPPSSDWSDHEELIRQAMRRKERPSDRVERLLTQDQTLRAAVDLARRALNGEIVSVDGEELEPPRDR
jgi:hypothetical protein